VTLEASFLSDSPLLFALSSFVVRHRDHRQVLDSSASGNTAEQGGVFYFAGRSRGGEVCRVSFLALLKPHQDWEVPSSQAPDLSALADAGGNAATHGPFRASDAYGCSSFSCSAFSCLWLAAFLAHLPPSALRWAEATASLNRTVDGALALGGSSGQRLAHTLTLEVLDYFGQVLSSPSPSLTVPRSPPSTTPARPPSPTSRATSRWGGGRSMCPRANKVQQPRC
jgi:hypothetical protein